MPFVVSLEKLSWPFDVSICHNIRFVWLGIAQREANFRVTVLIRQIPVKLKLFTCPFMLIVVYTINDDKRTCSSLFHYSVKRNVNFAPKGLHFILPLKNEINPLCANLIRSRIYSANVQIVKLLTTRINVEVSPRPSPNGGQHYRLHVEARHF